MAEIISMRNYLGFILEHLVHLVVPNLFVIKMTLQVAHVTVLQLLQIPLADMCIG